jgi:hypothetical protein
MERCLICIASLVLGLAAIASAAAPAPSEWAAATKDVLSTERLPNATGAAAWSTFAPSRPFTFVEIAL